MYIALENGLRLEMREPTKLTIKKKNFAHQYTKYELDRTSTFVLPLTELNKKARGIVDTPQVYNAEVRRRYNALLVSDSVMYDGILYCTKVSESGISATFIFGENLPLKNMFSVNIRERVGGPYDTLFTTMPMPVESAEGMQYYIDMTEPNEIPISEEFEGVEFLRTVAMARPYYNIAGKRKPKNLAINLNAVLGWAELEGVRIVAPEINLMAVAPKVFPLEHKEMFATKLTKKTDADPYIRQAVYDRTITPNVANRIPDLNRINLYYYPKNAARQELYHINFEALRFGADVQMALGELPEDMFLCSVIASQQGALGALMEGELSFWGGYKFTFPNNDARYPVIEGAPLGGRTIDLPRYTVQEYQDAEGNRQERYLENSFFFVRVSNISYDNNYRFAGFYELPEDTQTYHITYKNYDGLNADNDNLIWRLGDQLPNMTFGDLVRMYSFATGLYPVYNAAANVLGFSNYNSLPLVSIEQYLVKLESIERNVGIFDAQNVSIEYKKNQRLVNQVGKTWTIDNENLAESKTLYTFPMLYAKRNPMPNLLRINGEMLPYTNSSPYTLENQTTGERFVFTDIKARLEAGKRYIVKASSNRRWDLPLVPDQPIPYEDNAQMYLSLNKGYSWIEGTTSVTGVTYEDGGYTVLMPIDITITGDYYLRLDNNKPQTTISYFDFSLSLDSPNGVVIDDVQVNDKGELAPVGNDYTIAIADNDGILQTMNFVGMEGEREDIAMMCAESTMVVVDLKIPLFVFNIVFGQNKVYLHGAYYYWIEATWTDGKAKATLQKINK
jgi:hypothetical protein